MIGENAVFSKGRYLDECSNTKKNNLDFIRFVAAVLVIFSHAYPLTTGNNGSELFAVLTNGQMTFGHLAVITFFIISGFLITQSFDRSKDIVKFMKARILRIFPGLIVVVFLAAFVLGPFFTTLSLKDYLFNYQTLQYLTTISLYWIHYDLPGVFQNNVYPVAVNGSLWTLYYEFVFYIVVGVLGVSRLLNKWVLIVGFVVCTILFYLSIGSEYVNLFRYFCAGMLFYVYRKKIILNFWLAILSLVLLLISVEFGYLKFFFPIFGSYLIFYFAYQSKVNLHNFGKYGDFSYGIYIYAFPVQQIVTYYYGEGITPLTNFLISLPFTLIFAVLSWHLVEKYALRLKNFSFKRETVYTNSKAM